MTAFDKAWVVLKEPGRRPSSRNPSLDPERSMRMIPSPSLMPSTADPQKMTHEDVLNLLIHHGGIIGRMNNEMGSPDWSDDMDSMEGSGVFEALTALYGEHEPSETTGNTGAREW